MTYIFKQSEKCNLCINTV